MNAAVPQPSLESGDSEPDSAAHPVIDWTDLDRRAVDTVRVLAMDAVQRVGNGHPGTAMSLAPAAFLVWQRYLRHDASDPSWLGRDRFVLSLGHSSLTLYIQLYLSGYDVTLDDLKAFRTWGSRSPGHPEHGHTDGVETTTGPLGQGLGNAVGMAMAARYERQLLDPDAAPGSSVFDHTVWCFVSDGDLQEGITSEASSLAGTQSLGNLIVVWDDNHISIEGDTAVAFTEDTVARYAAYGWQVQFVDRSPDGDVDVQALASALSAARDDTVRPSFIGLRTTIAWPAPTLQNTGKSHGSALGAEEVAATKRILGFDPQQDFEVAPDVLAHARSVGDRGKSLRAEWDAQYEAWRSAQPDRAALLDRLVDRELPQGWEDSLPVFEPSAEGQATRVSSGEVLSALGPVLPELFGGSADLAGSNNTTIKGSTSFLPNVPDGRQIHFGIREHAMGSAMNGMALHGKLRPYGGTFLVFSDYMRPAVRLAALMGLPVTYVWTHDSIGLGEDGPTHQPVEHLTALRAIPGLDVVRPADANETAHAWAQILRRTDHPAGLCLSRQNVPIFDRSVMGSAAGTARGAYVLAEATGGQPHVILLATGTEVSIAIEARTVLEDAGTPTRVVSMPCFEWFAEQPQSYRDEVLPPDVTVRISVEAGLAMSWRDIVGDRGRSVSLEHYGASAAAEILYLEFGLTADAVVSAAHASLADLPKGAR